jgi:hypothetical protein
VHLALTPEQESLRAELTAYFAELVTPEVRASLQASTGEFGDTDAYKAVIRQIGQDGWLGIGWPEEYGGQARSMVDQLIFSDAAAVAGVLRDPQYCGYPDAQVALLTDASATRQGILDALDRLAGAVGEGETVLLFYAGHGMDGEDGAYHLATCDVRLVGEPGKRKVAAGAGISQSELLNKLRAIKAGRMLMIFNACHSGNISPATLADEAPPETGKSLPADTTAALLATGSGRIIITACRPQQYSFVGMSAQTTSARRWSIRCTAGTSAAGAATSAPTTCTARSTTAWARPSSNRSTRPPARNMAGRRSPS